MRTHHLFFFYENACRKLRNENSQSKICEFSGPELHRKYTFLCTSRKLFTWRARAAMSEVLDYSVTSKQLYNFLNKYIKNIRSCKEKKILLSQTFFILRKVTSMHKKKSTNIIFQFQMVFYSKALAKVNCSVVSAFERVL